jgi:broad specificity phosphatase PhoE
MQVLLIRHGETEENVAGIFQGLCSGVLTKRGKKQAQHLAERLHGVHIDYIFSSDLQRALDTAAPIVTDHPEAEFEEDVLLRERNVGEFEGTSVGDADWDSLPGTFLTNKPPGGESLEEVWWRACSFYKKLKKVEASTVLVVSHGILLCLLQGLLQGKRLEEAVEEEGMHNIEVRSFTL